jgi:hypothetical protein
MNASSGSGEQDWRLQADLQVAEPRRSLHDLLGRLRDPAIVKEVEGSVPHDVVVTHDGKRLFAYAADRATLERARSAIEGVLSRERIEASVRIGHWDDELDGWRQIDPPESAQEQRAADAAERDAETIETRTLVASSGRLVRADFERTMLDWAGRLGVECRIIEHPHLLTTQVGFTVTGPKRKLDEFSQGLAAEGWANVRTETGVMLSPL